MKIPNSRYFLELDLETKVGQTNQALETVTEVQIELEVKIKKGADL